MVRRKEFIQFRRPDGHCVRLLRENIVEAIETDNPREVMLRIHDREDPWITVVYKWKDLDAILPTDDHRLRRSPLKKAKAGIRPTYAGLTDISKRR